MIFTVGRLCVKLAGRDAGKKCVIVEVIDNNYVIVDGAARRKKVNVRHLEPLSETIDIKDKANHSEVAKAFEKLGLKVCDTKKKTVSAKPKQHRKVKEKPVKKIKAKKEVKKEVKTVDAVVEPKTVTPEVVAN